MLGTLFVIREYCFCGPVHGRLYPLIHTSLLYTCLLLKAASLRSITIELDPFFLNLIFCNAEYTEDQVMEKLVPLLNPYMIFCARQFELRRCLTRVIH